MAEQNQFTICILGSASYDQYLIVPHFPANGETVQAKESFFKNGGKGFQIFANQAVACARLKSHACFAGQLGTKPETLTKNLINEMASSGLDLKYMKQLDGVDTGQALIMLNEKGENSIVIVGGSNTTFENLNILPDNYQQAIKSSEIILLQKEIPIEINTLVSINAKKINKIVALDCGGRDEPIPKQFLENIDFLSPNETELARIIGDIDEDKLTADFIRKALLTQYPKMNVLLKLGSQGCKLINTNLDIYIDVVSSYNKDIMKDYKIIDTTGAGDCFTGAFFVRFCELLQKRNINELSSEEQTQIYKKSMFFANAAAFLCITVMGAMPSMPERKIVDDFLNKYFNKDLYQ